MSVELERQFRRCVISRDDFEEACAYLDYYQLDAHHDLVLRALLSSAVISYARPFSSNRSGPQALASNKLPIEVEGILSADQLALHKKILDCRFKGIAHSDSDVNPAHRVPRRDSAVMAWSIPFNLMAQGIDVQKFRELAGRLAYQCFVQQEKINKELPGLAEGAPRVPVPLATGVTRISISLSEFQDRKGLPKDTR